MSWTPLKLKTFCSVKDTVKTVERQATEEEFAKDTSGKGPLPKIYKECLKLKNMKTKQNKQTKNLSLIHI
mgnify:CR=1 FL=1